MFVYDDATYMNDDVTYVNDDVTYTGARRAQHPGTKLKKYEEI